MNDKQKGAAAFAYLILLAQQGHEFLSFSSSRSSHDFFDGEGIARSELQAFGNPEQMRKLSFSTAPNDERHGKIAFAILRFEFRYRKQHGRPEYLRNEIGNVAASTSNFTFDDMAAMMRDVLFDVATHVCRPRK